MFAVSLALLGAGTAAAALAARGMQKRDADRPAPKECPDPWLESYGMKGFCSVGNVGGPVGILRPSGFNDSKPFSIVLALHDVDRDNGMKDLLTSVEWQSQGDFEDRKGRVRPAQNRAVVVPMRGSRDVEDWMLPPDNARVLMLDTSLMLIGDEFPLPVVLTGMGRGGTIAGRHAIQTGFVPDAVQYLENPGDL